MAKDSHGFENVPYVPAEMAKSEERKLIREKKAKKSVDIFLIALFLCINVSIIYFREDLTVFFNTVGVYIANNFS